MGNGCRPPAAETCNQAAFYIECRLIAFAELFLHKQMPPAAASTGRGGTTYTLAKNL